MNQSEDEQGIPFTFKKISIPNNKEKIMTERSERERLIEELHDNWMMIPKIDIEDIADFILKDRKKYIKALKAANKIFDRMEYSPTCSHDGLNDYKVFKRGLSNAGQTL